MTRAEQKETIVSNESSEIIRFLYTEFDSVIESKHRGVTYYPEHLRSQIDEHNGWMYDTINNGVYKSGFASKQEPYEGNVKNVFSSLDRLEKMLEGKQYILGDQLTELDIRVYPTIVRFDPVYAGQCV